MVLYLIASLPLFFFLVIFLPWDKRGVDKKAAARTVSPRLMLVGMLRSCPPQTGS